jgi:ferredoxin
MKKNKSVVAFFSPAGTTRKVAAFIAGALAGKGHDAQLLDLGSHNAEDIQRLKDCKLAKGDCLWIGSPIYAGHALPPIKAFISGLPQLKGVFAVPFVTYGAVTSGTGLYEMAVQLSKQGCAILGAAKILAVHSLLWLSKNPPGKGHPGPDDEKLLKELIESALNKINAPDNKINFDLNTLNYQSEKNKEHAKAWNLKALQNIMPPITLDEEKCTSCGICAEECPVQNITLDPLPKIQSTENCLLCFNCIRHCEPGALANESLSNLETVINGRIKEYGEPAETIIFA